MKFLRRFTATKGSPQRPLKPPALEANPTTGPRTDPLAFDPVGHAWRDRLAQGQWEEYPAFLARCETRDERDFYLFGLADSLSTRPDWIDAWIRRDPADPLAFFARGVHGTAWAWAARGTFQAQYVGEDQWRVFHERLRESLQDLAMSLRLDPTDPGPRAAMIPIGSGLSMPLEERYRNWAAIAEIEPFHQRAGHAMIQTLAKKWSGSDDEMLAFARGRSAAAPDGHAIHAIVADAHVEAALEEGDSYLKRPEILDEVRAAAARSVEHPAYVVRQDSARDYNVFALIEELAGEPARTRWMLERSGELITYPWTMFTDKFARFRNARTRAGLA
jgi:hypothetical protein